MDGAWGFLEHPVRPLYAARTAAYLHGLPGLHAPAGRTRRPRSLTTDARDTVFRVRIAPLPDGLHQETHHPSADDLGLDPETFSDVEVDLRLDVAERRVLALYTARATARLECDRTLDLYDEPIEGDHSVLFTAEAPPASDDAPDDDGVQPLADDATHIDLTASVHDTLLLALPLRRVSPAARAAEIPTEFGGPSDDEPADDRWAALQALRSGDPDAGASDSDYSD